MNTTPASKISRDDLKAKLGEIQDEASQTVESAKSQALAVAVVVGAVVLALAFTLGRRAGRRKNTIIEIKRN